MLVIMKVFKQFYKPNESICYLQLYAQKFVE